MTTLSLKGIVDEYFSETGTKAKHSYTESSIKNIIVNAGIMIAESVRTGSDLSKFRTYIVDKANYYGVDITKAYSFLNEHPDYVRYFVDVFRANSQLEGKTIAEVFSDLVGGLTDIFTDSIWTVLKKIIPIILVLLVLYIGVAQVSKKYGK